MTTPAYAYGTPEVSGDIRTTPEDFQVDEILGFEPDGEGEHACLHIRKREMNTADVASLLARLADVRLMDVSYAGLKDRNALTTQWFSIYLGKKAEPDWTKLATENLELLTITRHGRKLRRGTLQGNRFTLIVRNLEGDCTKLESRLAMVAEQGVPNYFGEQRFGYNNLERATSMFSGQMMIKDRNKRSMYLSAARSAIFNDVLSQRVANGNWNKPLAGDMMMLDGSHSVFSVDELDDEIRQRAISFDIHPTAPMWGRGGLPTQHEALAIEQAVAEQHELFCAGLEQAGLKQERRSMRLRVSDMSWEITPENLTVKFSLTSGSYATSVLREIVTV